MVKLKPSKRPTGSKGPAGSRFLPLGLIAGPLGSIGPMLLRNWKLGIFGLLLAFIVYQNYMSFEILKPIGFRTIPGILQDVEEEQKKSAIIAEKLVACELGREELKTAVETTNAQIEQWVALSKRLQAGQAELSTALIDLKKKSSAELEIILQGPIPQTCEGAVKLLRDAVIKGDLVWKSDG